MLRRDPLLLCASALLLAGGIAFAVWLRVDLRPAGGDTSWPWRASFLVTLVACVAMFVAVGLAGLFARLGWWRAAGIGLAATLALFPWDRL